MNDSDDLSKLIAASKRMPGERALVTPCCGLTPELRDYRLHCACGKTFERLGELVVDERNAA